MINELLEKRDHLCDIAAELYGDMFICNDKFWGSPTEREMREVEDKLQDLGYVNEEITDEMKQQAVDIMIELIKKGTLK